MLRPSVAAILLLVGSQAAVAFSGTYVGQGEGRLHARIFHLEGQRYFIELTTISGHCLGSVKGDVYIRSNRASLAMNECVVQLSFNGRRVVTSPTNCGSYSGAACGFQGTLSR